MIYFVIGGSASGKSSYAEDIAVNTSKQNNLPLVYLACLDCESGGDTFERIARHKKMREGKGFTTVECTEGYGKLTLPYDKSVLLIEDIGNICANIIYKEKITDINIIKSEIDTLLSKAKDIVIVSNDITLEKRVKGAELYYDVLCDVNNHLASVCDKAVRLVAGISIVFKGN